MMTIEEFLIDNDPCYECRVLGDDYSFDDGGELVSNCDDCWVRYLEWGDFNE